MTTLNYKTPGSPVQMKRIMRGSLLNGIYFVITPPLYVHLPRPCNLVRLAVVSQTSSIYVLSLDVSANPMNYARRSYIYIYI